MLSTSGLMCLLTDHLGWILDTRLRDKKLDVRLKDMGSMFSGRYKGEQGHVTLRSNTKVKKTAPTVPVVIGLNAVRRHVPIAMIHPERTVFVIHPKRGPDIISLSEAIGTRVVIIGLDNAGSDRFVGKYGIVSKSEIVDPADVLIRLSPGQGPEFDGNWGWVNEKCLCRSTPLF